MKGLFDAPGSLVAPENKRDFVIRDSILTVALVTPFVFLYVVDAAMLDWKAIGAILSVTTIVAGFLISSTDPVQYGTSKEARFFQAQFPSRFIQERLQIGSAEARDRWFDFFNRLQDPANSSHHLAIEVFKKGYECRTYVYLRWIFGFLGLLAVVADLLYRFEVGRLVAPDIASPSDFYVFQRYSQFRLLFPTLYLAAYIVLRHGNSADEANPSGVWARWKEINDLLKVRWQRENPT